MLLKLKVLLQSRDVTEPTVSLSCGLWRLNGGVHTHHYFSAAAPGLLWGQAVSPICLRLGMKFRLRDSRHVTPCLYLVMLRVSLCHLASVIFETGFYKTPYLVMFPSDVRMAVHATS